MHRLKRCVAAALVLATLAGARAGAQVDANLGGLDEGNVKGYLAPLPEAFSGAINTSVFHSANIPIAGLTFSVGVEAMVVAFDDADRLYTPTHPAGFSPSGNGDVEVPTVVGDTTAVIVDGQAGTQLGYPGGFDIDNFALAVPQLTIGSFMGTKAVIRYIALEIDDTDLGDLQLIGFGAQHSISQYFPGLPVHLALGAFYQTFEMGEDLVDSKAFHMMAMASRSFGVAEPYVGVGFDSYSFKVSYDNETDTSDERIDVEFDGENDLHLTAGANVNLSLFHLHGEITHASSTSVAVGLRVGL
jgi:hypothetical protein